MTFRHWSGITPYTSSCEFAGSCVFGKQSAGNNSLRPLLREADLIANVRSLFCRVPWGSLTRSPWATRPEHLCRFAVRFTKYELRSFSWKRAHADSLRRISNSPDNSRLPCGFTYTAQSLSRPQSNKGPALQPSVTPSHYFVSHGILTVNPSPPAFAIGLGPTNPSMISIAKETLFFRRAGIPPALRLLVPTFSLPIAPAGVTPSPSLRSKRSPTTRVLH